MKEFFTKIKTFITEKSSAFKVRMRQITESLDSKVDPAMGNKIYKVFKYLSLTLIIIGLPTVAISFGIFALQGGPTSVVMATMYPLLSVFLLSLLGWFWFSKFNA